MPALVLSALIFCAGTGTYTAQTFHKPTSSMIMIRWSVGSYNKNFLKVVLFCRLELAKFSSFNIITVGSLFKLYT